MVISRRRFALLGAALTVLPRAGQAAKYRQITWDDLIPSGIPYGQIIGEGDLDEFNDTWAPIFDENASKLNTDLDGTPVRLPGYVIPLEWDENGVSDFVLVPYVGACIHVPPPPPNQLVFVTTETPWPSENLWDAVWVSGVMIAKLTSTDVADIGYQIAADEIEAYS